MTLALVRRRWVADGGGERFTAALAAALANAGHHTTIVSAGWTVSDRGVHQHRVPTLQRGQFLSLLSFTVAAAAHLRRGGYDLVQSHEKLPRQDVYRAGDGCHREWLRQRFRYFPSSREPFVRLAPHHRLMLVLERQLLRRRRYRLVVANSRRVRDDLGRNYGVPARDVRVIHNGVDVEGFTPTSRERFRTITRDRLALPADAMLLLFMGTGFERKGLPFVLRALPEIDEDVCLIVAGDDLEAGRYHDEARRLGIERRVRFVGAVAEPERLYAAADVFVLPTIYEPFSNACLEALASGLPVITSRANGAAELLTGNLAELTLDDPSDREALVDRIARLRKRSEREALGSAARAVAEARPIERMVAEFLDVYRELGMAV